MPNGQAGIESRDDGFLYADLKSRPVLHRGKTYVISSTEIAGGDFFYDRAVRAEATPSVKLIGPAYKGPAGGWQIEAQSADVTIYGPLNALLLDIPTPPEEKACLAPVDSQGYEVEEKHLLMDHFHVVVSCAQGYVGVPKAQACIENGGRYKLSGCHREDLVKSDVEVVHSKSKLKNVTSRTVEPNKTKVSGKVDVEIHHVHNQSQDHPDVTVEVKNITGKVKSNNTKVAGKIDIEIHRKGKDQDHPDVKVIHSKSEVKKVETGAADSNSSKEIKSLPTKDNPDVKVISKNITGRVESKKNTTKVTRDIDIKVSDNTTITGKVTTEIHKVTTAPPSKSHASSVKIEVDTKKVEANLAKEANLGETVEVDQQQLEELSKVEQKEVDKKLEVQEKKEEQKKVDKKVEMQEKKEASKQKQSQKQDNKEEAKQAKATATEETSLVKVQHGVAELNVEDVDTSPMELEVEGTNTENSTVSEVDAKYSDLMSEVSHALQDGKESHIAAA